ncbi:MAG: hypothetical protein JOZ52_00780, partial [Acidobacteria bacterium]|nr:hypothetical protein [Acidobacteriota bacterium]
ALRKDSSFAHEKEFRFVISSEPNGDKIMGIDSKPLNLSKLKMKVVCHPRMLSWKKANIQAMLKLEGIGQAFQESEIKLR